MSRRVEPLTVDRVADLPERCRACTWWELGPAPLPDGGRPEGCGVRASSDTYPVSARPVAASDRGADDDCSPNGSSEHGSSGHGGVELDRPAVVKRDWVRIVSLEWGTPGRVVYVDGVAVGYVTFAPAALVPRSRAYPTAPASEDAVLLLTARVRGAYAGQGLGRVLVQQVARDVIRRGGRAIEAYGARPGLPTAGCVLPVDFLAAVGFRTVREHLRYPRMRLDLRSTVSWRTDVEAAIERLFSPVRARKPGTVLTPGLSAVLPPAPSTTVHRDRKD